MTGTQHTKRSPERKAARKNGVFRMAATVIAIILEISLIVSVFTRLEAYSSWIGLTDRIFAIVLVLIIYNENKNSAFKTPWIILIMAVPLFGIVMYLMVGLNAHTFEMKRRYRAVDEKLYPMIDINDELIESVKDLDPGAGAICTYLKYQALYPTYRDTEISYFGDTCQALDSMLEDLRSARDFIFMEYFAIDDKKAWARIEEVLVEKVAAGVEVRVFYDDLGSIGFINTAFSKKLNSLGIKCRVFNPFFPGLNRFLNNRDHRKITVVDGRVGYTGGFNLADEYFNIERPYKAWKDCGVRVAGSAVDAMSMIFLENWNATKKHFEKDKVYEKYLTAQPLHGAKGFAVAFADSPMDSLNAGQDVYISMINRAVDYVYFLTPYLIITDELKNALCLAAMRGVDVRIVTPGIPDKKLVYMVTRSFYHDLCLRGVKIYEWTPGFMHGKLCVSDDQLAVCGTINLDYRSLYHHFEDAVFFGYCDAVIDAKDDFLKTQQESRDVTLDYKAGKAGIMGLPQMFARLFAELL